MIQVDDLSSELESILNKKMCFNLSKRERGGKSKGNVNDRMETKRDLMA